MNTIANNELLAAALVGYQAQLAKLDEKITEIRAQLDGRTVPATTTDGSSAAQAKRQMSAAGKARIAAAQRKRWAVFHKQQGSESPAKRAPGKKRVLSAAAKKRISEATKKRWAAYRTAKKRATA